MRKTIASKWFDIKRIDPETSLITEPHVIPLLRCNIWHLRGRSRDLMVDSGLGISSLHDAAKHLFESPVTAIATHTHRDHIGCHHEFGDCWVHRLEVSGLEEANPDLTREKVFDPEHMVVDYPGYEYIGPMITALPHDGYELKKWRVIPAKVTRVLEEGDVIDLGDRAFEVLHLPGHSPGSIGLWDRKSGTLFSGDTLYDGPLIDSLPHSSIPDYVDTMNRLRQLPVKVVYAGHDGIFGRERLLELTQQYLNSVKA